MRLLPEPRLNHNEYCRPSVHQRHDERSLWIVWPANPLRGRDTIDAGGRSRSGLCRLRTEAGALAGGAGPPRPSRGARWPHGQTLGLSVDDRFAGAGAGGRELRASGAAKRLIRDRRNLRRFALRSWRLCAQQEVARKDAKNAKKRGSTGLDNLRIRSCEFGLGQTKRFPKSLGDVQSSISGRVLSARAATTL